MDMNQVQVVSARRSADRGARKLGGETCVWISVEYVAVSVSVCHQGHMVTNMSVLVTETWGTQKETQNALNSLLL